jgi:hypothetical protein
MQVHIPGGGSGLGLGLGLGMIGGGGVGGSVGQFGFVWHMSKLLSHRPHRFRMPTEKRKSTHAQYIAQQYSSGSNPRESVSVPGLFETYAYKLRLPPT